MDAFYLLAVLACPVGMGAMMWFMMKAGNRPHGGGTPAPQDRTTGHAGFGSDPRQQEVAALREEITELRARLDKRSERSRTPAEERTR